MARACGTSAHVAHAGREGEAPPLTLSCALGTPEASLRKQDAVTVGWRSPPCALCARLCRHQVCRVPILFARSGREPAPCTLCPGSWPPVLGAGPCGPPGVPAGAVLEGQCHRQGLLRKTRSRTRPSVPECLLNCLGHLES